MPSFWENLRFAGEREGDGLSGQQGQDMATYISHPPPSVGTSFPGNQTPLSIETNTV